MEFRIADTFTDSLARLNTEEQKAAKITALDLQRNPVMSENSKGLRSPFFLWNDGQMVWPQQYRTWHTIVKPPRTTNSCHCPDPSHRHMRADPLSVRAQR